MPATTALLAMTALMLGAAAAHAIVIRHDVPDADYQTYAEAPAFAGVGLLSYNGNPSGSGTLVLADRVLTAAHVADDAPVERWTFELGGRTHVVADVCIHPKWTGDLNDNFDVAVMRLAAPIEDVPLIGLHDAPLSFGDDVTIIGYGATGTGQSGYTTFDLRKRAATNIVEGFLLDYVLLFFDAPGSGLETPLEGMAAPVDSGGPVLIETRDGWRVAATHSFILDTSDDGVLANYDDVHGAFRLDLVRSWLDEVLADPVAGDVDGDGVVGVSDLIAVVLEWGFCPAGPVTCRADLDGDGMVGVGDLVIVILNWT